VIDFKRAADALRLLPRPEHEVFDEKLAAPIKQLGQCHLAFRRIKDVLLVDLHPRQRVTLRGQLIAQAGEFLLPFEQILARNQPFFSRHNFVI
jgi:hypothetical protein